MGAKGSAKPSTLKVSATYNDGFSRGRNAYDDWFAGFEKAQRSAAVVAQRLSEAGWSYREWVTESVGSGSCIPLPTGVIDTGDDFEAVLRIAVESEDRAAVEAFAQEMIPLVTAGSQGTTGLCRGTTARSFGLPLLALLDTGQRDNSRTQFCLQPRRLSQSQ